MNRADRWFTRITLAWCAGAVLVFLPALSLTQAEHADALRECKREPLKSERLACMQAELQAAVVVAAAKSIAWPVWFAMEAALWAWTWTRA